MEFDNWSSGHSGTAVSHLCGFPAGTALDAASAAIVFWVLGVPWPRNQSLSPKTVTQLSTALAVGVNPAVSRCVNPAILVPQKGIFTGRGGLFMSRNERKYFRCSGTSAGENSGKCFTQREVMGSFSWRAQSKHKALEASRKDEPCSGQRRTGAAAP